MSFAAAIAAAQARAVQQQVAQQATTLDGAAPRGQTPPVGSSEGAVVTTPVPAPVADKVRGARAAEGEGGGLALKEVSVRGARGRVGCEMGPGLGLMRGDHF